MGAVGQGSRSRYFVVLSLPGDDVKGIDNYLCPSGHLWQYIGKRHWHYAGQPNIIDAPKYNG